jgi:hypothetical protein
MGYPEWLALTVDSAAVVPSEQQTATAERFVDVDRGIGDLVQVVRDVGGRTARR